MRSLSMRSAVSEFMGVGESPTLGFFAYRLIAIVAILLSVTLAALSTLPDIAPGDRVLIDRAGAFVAAIFALEYAVRLWLAPQFQPDDRAARRHYALGFLGLVDFVSVLPLLLVLTPAGFSHDLLIFAQLLALMKLARLATGLPLIVTVLRNEARSLLAALLAMLVVLVLASSIMYFLERTVQPQSFSSIPRALWWGIVTMGTVGYGDMVPMTPLGRFFGGFIILLGVALFAVPAGILATGFADEVRRRDFVVTWHAVARVPLFSGLDASRIAAIARLLKPQIVPVRQVVIRRGEPADAMFFIMEGEVEVDVLPNPVRLGKGQFFGEIALVMEGPRTATVTAITETRLLALDRADFHRLIEQHPEIKTSIEKIAAERLRGQTKA